MNRLRLLPLLAAAAVLAATGLTGSVAVADTSASTSVPSQWSSTHRPAGSFVVTGAVVRHLRLDVADLRALPSRTVAVTFQADSGVEHHVYVGPRLVDVLAKAGPQFDPTIKNDKLRYFVSVSASDGYRALVAYSEIDPDLEAKNVLLATSEDGRSLDADGPRLVVPGDSHGGRYVTNVVRVFLDKPAR
ncbi:MAG: molybdopterin-dependent oxidoreductase [Pseudonocardiaceae bacterium]